MFNTYEELMETVEERRQDTLTLEVELDVKFSAEHEAAKVELKEAKAMKMLTGGQEFLGDQLAALEQRVADTKPPSRSVFIRYKKISLKDWALLMKKQGVGPIEQYESVLQDVFVGLYGVDPDAEGNEGVEPLTTDPRSVSSLNEKAVLSGGLLHSVVASFMAWQNSGGGVSIRPTRSGLV